MTRRDQRTDDDDVTQFLNAIRAEDWDGATWEDVSGQHRRTDETRPLDGYRPAPPAFPALPPQPEQRAVLPDVPVTETAVIGDQIRRPIIWCEIPRCITWCTDTEAAGERDLRHRAHAHGWRTDSLGRLACPPCQQHDPAYRTSRPVAWAHPEVRRRWASNDPLTDTGAFRLAVQAEYGRRILREDPPLARDIAWATYRSTHPAGTP